MMETMMMEMIMMKTQKCLKKTVKNDKNNNLHTKLKNKSLYLTNTEKLIDRINKLDPNRKYLDKETYKLYNIIENESIDLINAINSTGETPSREKLKDIFNLIREIFTEKKEEDMSRLETDEGAEKRT